MNWKRVLIGGLAAGVLMNVLDVLVGMFLLSQRYMALQKQGIFLQTPRLPFVPLWILGMFAAGMILAWLYASVRPRLGPGPKTAVMVGLAVGLLAHVPYPFSMASWGLQGRFIALVWMLSGLLEYVAGTLLAGSLYKE